MKSSKVIIAAAGAGKTTFLIKEALGSKADRVLITTYTEANAAEIQRKIIEINRFVPSNITVQTWFSFLLQHGVRPYQGALFAKEIRGMLLVDGRSAPYTKGNDVEVHYFDSQKRIYSDKIAKFMLACDQQSGGKVIDRLSRIYGDIFIDEAQDLSGFDLELLKILFKSRIFTRLVCDPRQATYSTSASAKNAAYSKAGIIEFFNDQSAVLEIEENVLNVSHRCRPEICQLADNLFPDFPETKSGNQMSTGHDGLFLVKPQDVDSYLSKYEPVQLRESRRTNVNDGHPAINFGESKGLSFDRVLIYPTAPIKKWLSNRGSELAPTSRSKLYVAITRARYSAAFVFDFQPGKSISDFLRYSPQN